MTYEQTIEYLYTQLPMFSRIGAAAFKKDLHNTLALCEALDNPHKKFKSIHIAGTNGKGSTSHMLAAILQQAGYKTGLYTSPHLRDFGERIRINGQMIKKEFVIEFTERTKILSEKIQPSFFELTVAMAFDYFAKEKIDIAVIETGLGGRLDSTNVISPILSVITNIGYDHMNLLGNSLQEIASEKAGIIKEHTPVVIGELLEDTRPVFTHKANEMNAPIFFAQDMFEISGIQNNNSTLDCRIIDTKNKLTSVFSLDLRGIYQAKNLRTVLAAEQVLSNIGYMINDVAKKHALKNVKKLTGLSGRWDIVAHNPAMICDVAHNEDGIKQLLQQLQEEYGEAHIHFVLGFVKDKDIDHVLSLFPTGASYYFTNAHIPRALPWKELKIKAAEKKLSGDGYDNVNDAILQAKNNASKEDVIMVCGSFFIIAEINY